MSFWFRLQREHSDDPQNSMFAEMYRLLLQTRTEVTGANTSTSDLERKRVDLVPSESYIIIVAGNCFVHSAQRTRWYGQKYYPMREPERSKQKCWVDFDHRASRLIDKSIRGNNVLMKGMPIISSYQPEYMSSSLHFDGNDYVDMGNTRALKIGEYTDNSITLDGVNDFVDLGARTGLWSKNLSKFTIGMWVKASDAFTVNYKTFFGCADDVGGGDTDAEISMYFIKAGVDTTDYNAIGADITNDNYTTSNVVMSAYPIVNGTWYHVFLDFDNTRTGNCLNLYINTTLQSNENDYADNYNAKVLDIDAGTKAFLGKYQAGDTDEYGGKIKDVRFWTNTILTDKERALVYLNHPDAPTGDYWLRIHEGSGDPVDAISGSFTGVLTNGPVWNTDAPSVWRDTELTAAYWVYFTSNPGSDAHIITKGNTQSFLGFIATNGKHKAQFWYRDGTNAVLDSGVTGTNGWHRVMISHSKTNQISKIWVDGVLKASNTKNDSLRGSGIDTASRFMLGAKSTGTSTQSNFLTGWLDNVMVWRRQLTDAEAAADYAGEFVSPEKLVSQWEFDEDEFTSKAFDSQSFNTGTISGANYDNVQVPTLLEGPYPYNDGVVNYLIGYRTTGDQYLIIPELSDDFRITSKTTGNMYYEFVVKFSGFDTVNNNYMRLLQKADDFTQNYFHSIQIRTDGKLYLAYKFGGVVKKARTVSALKLNKLYRIVVELNYDQIAGGTETDIFNVFLNGFETTLEATTELGDYPNTGDIKDFHTYLLAGNETLRGNFVGSIYSFRYYEENATSERVLSLMCNKLTTQKIDRGTIVRSNLTKLAETNVFRPTVFDYPLIPAVEYFDYTLTDTVPTGRFTTIANDIPIDDEFKFTLSAGPVKLGTYSLDLDGNDYVVIPMIDPVRRNFSISVWVKYDGNVGGWGGIISNIDGLPNGNRLLVTSTQIRWNGQFDDEDEPWNDYRVTVSSISGAWHHIAMTYDGDDDEELKLFLDGHRVFKVHRDGQIKGRDQTHTYIGRGADDDYYLDGKLDELILYNRTLSESEVKDLFLKKKISAGIMAHYNFEKNVRDIENGDFNGSMHGGKFSTDTP